MKHLPLLLLLLIPLTLQGQDVNPKVVLSLSQASILRVDAGGDMNLDTQGLAILGEALSVRGGTPGYIYHWEDAHSMEYPERNPQVNAPGDYILTVTDQNNCSASDSMKVQDYGTGTDRPGHIGGIELYTDSRRHILEISIPRATSGFSLAIYHLDGKLLYREIQGPHGSSLSRSLNLAYAPGGIYLLEVHNNEWRYTRKFHLQ